MATSIQDAKVLIGSNKVSDRNAGLKDLIHILKHNRGRPALENLGNKSYLALCETLFQCMRDERSSWLRSRARTTKAAAALALSATALRQIVASGVRAFRLPTVEAVVYHIVDVLPGNHGPFVQPLLEDLPKALRALVEYQPHVERLSVECWEAAVDFCLQSLAALFVEPQAAPDDSWHSTPLTSSRSRTPAPSREARHGTSKHIPDELLHTAEDFVHCLQLLTKASNAPLQGKADHILTALVDLLQSKIGRASSAAFASINSVLARCSLQYIALTKRTVQQLLPLIKSSWSDALLRDELIMTLMHTDAHISSLLLSSRDESTKLDVEALVETMYGDYRKRQEGSALQFLEDDHLCFRHPGKARRDTHPLNTFAFSLGVEHVRCEGLFSTVFLVARFSSMLDEMKRALWQERDDADDIPIKRLRITHHFQEYLRHVSEPRSNAKKAALQVVAFMLQEVTLDEEDLQQALERLTPCISDENPAHSAWAMIALVAAAFQPSSRHASLFPLWVSVWQSASRTITSISSSRTACHLMDLLLRLKVVPFSAVSEIAHSMLLSIELNGPALLAETSCSLLTTVLRERTMENPTNFNQSADRVLYWLFGKWTPSLFAERAFSTLHARYYNARDVLQLLSACLDRPFPATITTPFVVLGSIAQTKLHTSERLHLSRYLLLLPDQEIFQLPLEDIDGSLDSATSEQRHAQLEARVLEYCLSECDKINQRWKDMTRESPQNVTVDMLRVLANFCFAASATGTLSDPAGARYLKLELALKGFAQSFGNFLSRREIDQYKVDAVLEACASILPDVTQLKSLTSSSLRDSGALSLAPHLSSALEGRRDARESFYPDDDDFMDVDDDPNSQTTGHLSLAEQPVPRHDLQARSESASLHACCSAYLQLISTIIDLPAEQDPLQIPSAFVDHLSSIPEHDLIRCRQLLKDLLAADFYLDRDSCQKLLDRVGEALLDPKAREYNTSEVASIMVVEILIGTTSTWTQITSDAQAQHLFENVEDLYAYYVKGMEKSGVRRTGKLQQSIARLSQGLLRLHPEFGYTQKLSSVRTILFELLAHGDIVLQWYISQHLPDMFENFVLSKHCEILKDLDEKLSGDRVSVEGIAIRLLILARLASRWHTLLRKSISTVFAIAGSNGQVSDYARRCVADIASSRNIESPQALFRLFSQQLIFEWLRQWAKFEGMPFAPFGYPGLIDMLRDVESEAFGQTVMLGLESELHVLAEQLATTAVVALKSNFSKAAAYTISWDTCIGSARNRSANSHAKLLMDLMGNDAYYTLSQSYFSLIIGQVFRTMDHELRFSKLLSKNKKPAFTAAAKAMLEMDNISHSSQEDLELGVEPSFSAYYLIDELERLCRRVPDIDTTNFWTAESYTYVIRMLLDCLHPALGSLHSHSVIRKIKILVALAGEVAFEGYPLQNTLQSLRPFLTDIQCAEDTLGIVQYLFAHGKLGVDQLNFVTGIGLSILISLRVFLGSAQESTTQEFHHTATMTKTQRFHAWLTNHLASYAGGLATADPPPRRAFIKAFKAIIIAASRVRTEGNSIRGSEEANLLMAILDDVRSNRRLLSAPSREVALNLLCRNFQPAPRARDDVLGSDTDAASFASQVWQSCQRQNVGSGYLLWSARVLGRTFSAYGSVRQSNTESIISSVQQPSSKDLYGRPSRATIIRKIVDLFYSDDREEVGLAEDGIRTFISRLPDDERYLDEVNQLLPMHIGTALSSSVPGELESVQPEFEPVEQIAYPHERPAVREWIKRLAVTLCKAASQDPVLVSLPRILTGVHDIAEKLFPFILHIVLLREFDGQRSVRQAMSSACMSWFKECNAMNVSHVSILIEAVLYLRSQPTPKETTRVDRDRWLEIDFLQASRAATTCGMYRSALLFAETASGRSSMKSSNKRSSILAPPPKLPLDLQLSIYKNLDEPDSFYGVDRGYGLASVLDRLDYEGDGMKSLLFRGARMDSQMRRTKEIDSQDTRGTVKSLIKMNMNSITSSLLINDPYSDVGEEAVTSTLDTARKLSQWDIKAPEANHTEPSTLFKAFQGLHFTSNTLDARKKLDRQFLVTMSALCTDSKHSAATNSSLRVLAVLSEADEVLSSATADELFDCWDHMKTREKWMAAGEFQHVQQLLSCRETLFSVLSSNAPLLDSLHARTGYVRQMQVEALLSSSAISRKHGALQDSLASVTYLSDIVEDCKTVGLDIEATAQHEVASVLWEQGEAEASIRMRQHLIENTEFDSQKTDISLPVLLAKLGHHLAEARLAKPDTIIEDYLHPAIQELKGQTQGPDSGQVYHKFALFCDKQLLNPDAAEDLARIKSVMDRKKQESEDFQALALTEKNKSTKDNYRRAARRAMDWWKLDNVEYERLRRSREQFLRQCLENYLLSLQASDDFNTDALRIFSLWLEYSDSPLANLAVGENLSKVASGKFALLMNQLASRLQDETNDFQNPLNDLVYRICVDHPYHGMHQIFAISMKMNTREEAMRAKDESAKSRQKAAITIANRLGQDKKAQKNWAMIYRSNTLYHAVAMFKSDQVAQAGRDFQLDKYAETKEMMKKVPTFHVPPATLSVEVRASCDYSDLPTITAFKQRVSVANGLSAPKIITAQASDGKFYKQLFKSGNDDMRQDAIMEQVFDQVSRLLKKHTATRLRNLGIRTYKVLPLSTRSGLMEFVPDTIALHNWVMPAHERYHPSDWRGDRCRKEIGAAQGDSLNNRLKVWQRCAENFHPVLRYFLLERFEDPDEWFEKRLAYTRSTAAISVLGHVLGLGDRHCHNILLDEKSGEIVHIDLGVSFEAGRVLPVPEVVPFRLTRDLVDAMGYTKTEGVFRRCCEFTMDTLREERESIMTLLNVLRYDPLVNWSINPTKAKRMQEGETSAANPNGTARGNTIGPRGTPAPTPGLNGEDAAAGAEAGIGVNGDKKREEQAGEAGRALSVVEKKLSKTLSTKATVNELIQQATDERNLAVLYSGWASYA